VLVVSQSDATDGDVVYLDNASFALDATSDVELMSPIQATMEGTPFGWEMLDSGSGGSVQDTHAQGIWGALQLTAGSTGLNVQMADAVSVTPAEEYRASMVVASSENDLRRYRIRIVWTTPSGQVPGTASPWRREVLGEWAGTEITDSAPDGATGARVRLEIEGAEAGEVHMIDHAALCKSQSLCL
jgi:hypothetical protein